ncbi:unnamed protein product, partial [Nesidiocoris tenuis]
MREYRSSQCLQIARPPRLRMLSVRSSQQRDSRGVVECRIKKLKWHCHCNLRATNSRRRYGTEKSRPASNA